MSHNSSIFTLKRSRHARKSIPNAITTITTPLAPPFYAPTSLFIVALIRFGPVGVSSPATDSSSLCAADAVFRFVDFFLAVAVVGDGLGSSKAVLSGITFCH